MHLRGLRLEDAPLVLEWMHDNDVTHHLSAGFASKSIEDCEDFIVSSRNASVNLHMAIASDTDEYMGTVSLKNIDRDASHAEFAITVRKSAMGRGYAWFGMSEIIKIAFEELNLKIVYWCVSRNNERACRFYDKHDFKESLDIPKDILARYDSINGLKWYSVQRQ